MFTLSRRVVMRLLFASLTAGYIASAAEPETKLEILEPLETSYISTDGTVSFKWTEGGEGDTYRLERSESPSFRDPLVVYQGPDQGTFISGLPAGLWYYRLSVINNDGKIQQSAELREVQVEFVSSAWVWTLMVSGGVTFILILSSVLYGSFQYRAELSTEGGS